MTTMTSQYPYDGESDEEFEVMPPSSGDGIGRSMGATLEMSQIKQTKNDEVAKIISASKETATLKRATTSVSSTTTVRSRTATARSEAKSPIIEPGKSHSQKSDRTLNTPSTLADSDEEEGLDEPAIAERRLAKQKERLERFKRQRESVERLSTPRRVSLRDDGPVKTVSSRGLLPEPPSSYGQVRVSDVERQTIQTRSRRQHGHHSLGGHETRGQHGATAQAPGGVLQKAIDWMTGEDIQTRRLEHAMHAIAYFQKQHTSLSVENEGLKADLLELRGTNQQFASELREAQVKSFKEMTKDSWVPLEDRVVEEKLAEIHKDLEDWVEDNCVDAFEDMVVLSESDQQLLLDFLRKITAVGEPEDLAKQIEIWEKQNMDIILLVTAAITHQMYMLLFGNPFLIVDSLVGSTIPEHYSSAMKTTYDALLSVNAKGAHRWRADLMRILLPKPSAGGKFDGLQPAREETLHFVRSHCEQLVEQLENTQLRAFFKADRPEDSKAQLVDIWVRGAEIYIQLQTQLSSIYWPNPCEIDLIGYSYDNKYVEAHRSQAFPEGSNMGKPVVLVISPFLALRGNEDGERYDRERVVSKAVVKVVKGDEFLE